MKNEIKTGIRELFIVFTNNNISYLKKIHFLLIYPIDLIFILLSPKKIQRKAIFLDGRKFQFLGAHYNLVLNHIVWHLSSYYKYYREATIVIDIGASFGTFARMVHLFNPRAKIFSIEMVKESF